MRGREGVVGLVIGVVVLAAAIAVGVWLTGSSSDGGGPASPAAEEADELRQDRREEALELRQERQEEAQELEEERREGR